MKQLSIEELKELRSEVACGLEFRTNAEPTVLALDELISIRETQKEDRAPVGWEVCSPEWCNKHKACHEAPRIWFESEDGTGPHYHPSDYTTPPKPVINLNHVGRITAQVCGQRYTYWSAEDIRHYFEEMKCEIVGRAASSGDTVYIPHQELPKPVVVKLPAALMPAIHNSGELFMTPDNVEQGGYLNRDDVTRVLRDAGIVVKDGE